MISKSYESGTVHIYTYLYIYVCLYVEILFYSHIEPLLFFLFVIIGFTPEPSLLLTPPPKERKRPEFKGIPL